MSDFPELDALKKAYGKSKRTRQNVEDLRDAVDEMSDFARRFEQTAGSMTEINNMTMELGALVGYLEELVEADLYKRGKFERIQKAVEDIEEITADDTDVFAELVESFEEAQSRAETAVDNLEEGYTADDRDDAWEEAKHAAEQFADLAAQVIRMGSNG